MKTKLSLKPGQKGTKGLCAKYGDSLMCVRYRYDEVKKKRFKTVELIIEETDWEPENELKTEMRDSQQSKETVVGVRIGIGEGKLQHKIRNAGGKWNKQCQLWEIGYETAVKLGMKERIEKILRRGQKVVG